MTMPSRRGRSRPDTRALTADERERLTAELAGLRRAVADNTAVLRALVQDKTGALFGRPDSEGE